MLNLEGSTSINLIVDGWKIMNGDLYDKEKIKSVGDRHERLTGEEKVFFR